MDFSGYFIVTDMDGTFLSRDGKGIPQRNLDALSRFVAGGGHFTVASGRLHMTMRPTVGLHRELLTAPAICANGSYLFDFGTGEQLFGNFIAPELAGELVSFIREHASHVACRVSTPRFMRTVAAVGPILRDMALYREDEVEILPLDRWPLTDWYKLVFRDEPEVLAALRVMLDRRFGDRLAIVASGHHFLEIMPRDCSKASALCRLREHLGAESSVLIACGDFENDLPMLRVADVAVAPANAIDAVRAEADYVLCHCDEGLIADVVELIEAGKLGKRKTV